MDNSEKFLLMLDNAIRQEPDSFKNFDITKNVQDQLQDMIEDSCYKKIRHIYHFLDSEIHEPDLYKKPVATIFTSMEQLWLAFVMKEKYNKTWNGEEWVGVKKALKGGKGE